MAWRGMLSKSMNELSFGTFPRLPLGLESEHELDLNMQWTEDWIVDPGYDAPAGVHVCQTSPGSAGARDFVFASYTELKKLNPTLPILVRENAGSEATIWARYDFGVEKSIKVDGMSKAEVAAQVEALVKAGESMSKAG